MVARNFVQDLSVVLPCVVLGVPRFSRFRTVHPQVQSPLSSGQCAEDADLAETGEFVIFFLCLQWRLSQQLQLLPFKPIVDSPTDPGLQDTTPSI